MGKKRYAFNSYRRFLRKLNILSISRTWESTKKHNSPPLLYFLNKAENFVKHSEKGLSVSLNLLNLLRRLQNYIKFLNFLNLGKINPPKNLRWRSLIRGSTI